MNRPDFSTLLNKAEKKHSEITTKLYELIGNDYTKLDKVREIAATLRDCQIIENEDFKNLFTL